MALLLAQIFVEEQAAKATEAVTPDRTTEDHTASERRTRTLRGINTTRT
jgi:hypothetical protein